MSVIARAWLFTALVSWIGVALIMGAAFTTGKATVDYFPSLGTFGVSAGSSVHYCSAEWKVRGLASVFPMVSCESAP
jgi:uncharacterized membrane protein YkvI